MRLPLGIRKHGDRLPDSYLVFTLDQGELAQALLKWPRDKHGIEFRYAYVNFNIDATAEHEFERINVQLCEVPLDDVPDDAPKI